MLSNKNRFNCYFFPHPLTRYYLVFALAVIAAMAVISSYNKHPDEHHHFLASQYYTHHWLPPKVGDPAARQTYSIWGTSYHSWTSAFQAQGRYLFPIIGMIGLLIYQNNKCLHNWITNAFMSCLFLLSSYSFLFVALYQINR